eukprot:Gb_37907 [translate_table: standard]
MEKSGDEGKWWTNETVAVVTGANKSIGLEVVRHLAKEGITVVLTAEESGLAAPNSVVAQGYSNVHFHQLDVQSDSSVSDLAHWLEHKFNGFDILINNAGIAGEKVDWEFLASRGIDLETLLKDESLTEGISVDYDSAKACINTNYFGVKRTVKASLPLFKPSPLGSRIVNVSSLAGLLKKLRNEALRKQLSEVENLNEEEIDAIVNSYLNDVKSGQVEGKGWPTQFTAYNVSKIALNAYTRVLARDISEHPNHHHKIYVNCLHPGFVRTDMTLQAGDISAAEGAAHVVRVALFPPGGPSGHFFNMDKMASF